MRDIKEPNKKLKALFIFLTTFVISFVVISQSVRLFTPNVDVEIGNAISTENAPEEEISEEEKKAVDERLKWIQFEDNVTNTDMSEVEYSNNPENEVDKNETSTETKKEKLEMIELEEKAELPRLKTLPKINVGPNNENTAEVQLPVKELEKIEFKMNKVIVGEFGTIEEAMSAQNKLINSNLNIIPYIKGVNGKFILQAGSFANKEMAVSLASQISAMGYNTQILAE